MAKRKRQRPPAPEQKKFSDALWEQPSPVLPKPGMIVRLQIEAYLTTWYGEPRQTTGTLRLPGENRTTSFVLQTRSSYLGPQKAESEGVVVFPQSDADPYYYVRLEGVPDDADLLGIRPGTRKDEPLPPWLRLIAQPDEEQATL
jgi:hypothetical protein